MLLKSKTAFITGATGNLGRVLARHFLAAGADLILQGRDRAELENNVRKLSIIATSRQSIQYFTADLADTDQLAEMKETFILNYPLPDILINNAAIQGPIGFSWDNDWTAWVDTIRVNLFAPVALCRMLIPAMSKRGSGTIINISGGGATGPRPYFTAYACSKAALVRFSETLAEELKGTGVRVNCIAPGALKTKMTAAIIHAGKTSAGEKEYYQALKLSEKDDEETINRAAELAVYLASSVSNGITGKLISAVWDPWDKLNYHVAELTESDIYTLRRIVPGDRGKNWEKH